MAFAHHHRVGVPGVQRRRSLPLPAVPRKRCFAAKTMWGPRSAPFGAAMDSSAECGLAPLRVRGLERVALHADLVMLARLSQALARAAGRSARRKESGRHDSQRRHSERRWPAGGPHSASQEMSSQLKGLRESADSARERADTQQERIDLAARELTEVSDRLQAAANALRESI
jgi:hypothetical protein